MTYDRIVSLAPSNTEILYALDADDRIVATTAVCDHPTEASDKPSVGGWTNPDVDAVADHDPDLVLASDALQDDAVERCREAGLTVEQLTPTRLHDVLNTVKRIGELVDRDQAAQDLVDDLNRQIHDLSTRNRTDTPRTYCEEWHDPPMIGGNWIPDLIRMLGGDYLINPGERSRRVTGNEIQAFDPDHIVLHYCGFDDATDPDQVLDRDGWQDITAIQHDEVHVIDDSLLNRPGPRLVEGMRELHEIIYS